MVEINNQRKAFLDMLAWSEGPMYPDETQKSWLWRHCRRRAIYWLPDHPRKLVTLNPKLKSTGRRTLPASFPLVGCLPQAVSLKDFFRKVRTLWHCSRLKSVALYLWLIVVIFIGNRPLQQYSGHCRALVMVSSSIRLTAWLQNSRSAEWSERLMYEQSHRDYSASRYLHHRLSVPLIITVITPLPTKPSATKNARELKLANAAMGRHADASAWCCCARCKIHEGVSWCCRKWCSAWWCCRWSSSVAHQQSVSQCVKLPRLRGVMNAASPRLADTAERDYFTLRERLITMQKQLEGTQKYINEQCR